ncbi:MAG: hypothetical protein QXD27_08635 [Metallosphaera sp.]
MSEISPSNPLQRISSNFITILNSLPSTYQAETIQFIKTTLLNNGLQQIVPQYLSQLVPSTTPAAILSSIQKEITTGQGEKIKIQQLPELVEQTQNLIEQLPSVISRTQLSVKEAPAVLAAIIAVPYIKENILPKVIQTSSSSVKQLPNVLGNVETEVLTSPLVINQ